MTHETSSVVPGPLKQPLAAQLAEQQQAVEKPRQAALWAAAAARGAGPAAAGPPPASERQAQRAQEQEQEQEQEPSMEAQLEKARAVVVPIPRQVGLQEPQNAAVWHCVRKGPRRWQQAPPCLFSSAWYRRPEAL